MTGLVKQMQYIFFNKILQERADQANDPFMSVRPMCDRANTPHYRYINEVLKCHNNKEVDLKQVKSRVRASKGTTCIPYCKMNPDLDVHPVYAASVPEHERLSFTRLRVISHNLIIETARWSRVPREQRLCNCGVDVQTEEYFLRQCQVTAHLRGGRQISIDELFGPEPAMLTRRKSIIV